MLLFSLLKVSDKGTQISCVRHRATQRECIVGVETSACRIEVGLQVGESALRSNGFAANPEMLSMLTEESIIRAVQAFKARAKGMSTLPALSIVNIKPKKNHLKG